MNADTVIPLTERVLGAIFEVSNTLGAGFLEKVYLRALLHELRIPGIRVVEADRPRVCIDLSQKSIRQRPWGS